MAATLSPDLRARARRLAIASHQPGMTHRRAYTEDLPTLALIELGASETIVGLQRAFEPLGQILQFPTLRAVGRFRKRSILIAGQIVAVLGGLPLVFFGLLGTRNAIPIVLASLGVASVGIVITSTVWFPLLRGYVEPDRVGAFFGVLRTTWHITLIAFFLVSQQWLAAHPGAFGAIFGLATAAGLLRIVLVARLPEAEVEMGGVRAALERPPAAEVPARRCSRRSSASRGGPVRHRSDATGHGALRRGGASHHHRLPARRSGFALSLGQGS
jgi:hypothetical protein